MADERLERGGWQFVASTGRITVTSTPRRSGLNEALGRALGRPLALTIVFKAERGER